VVLERVTERSIEAEGIRVVPIDLELNAISATGGGDIVEMGHHPAGDSPATMKRMHRDPQARHCKTLGPTAEDSVTDDLTVRGVLIELVDCDVILVAGFATRGAIVMPTDATGSRAVERVRMEEPLVAGGGQCGEKVSEGGFVVWGGWAVVHDGEGSGVCRLGRDHFCRRSRAIRGLFRLVVMLGTTRQFHTVIQGESKETT